MISPAYNKMKLIRYGAILCSIIIGLRLATLGAYPLLDPTESRYAEIGRKMLETGNWVTPFIEYTIPFWAKPPLSFWATAFSYSLFGVNSFAARAPSFLFMLATAGLTFLLVLRQQGKCQASLALYILASQPLFFYMAGGVMTDPSLVFSATLTMVMFWQAMKEKSRLWGYGFFIGIALCLLAKGPIGIILTGGPIFLWVSIYRKWTVLWQRLPWISGTVLTLLVALPWYIAAELRTPGFLKYFIIGEHFERFLVKGWKGDLYGGGRARTVGSIWLFALIAIFPWSFFVLAAPFKKHLRLSLLYNEWLVFHWLWALFPLVFFTFARNILVSYVITSLPALAVITLAILEQWKKHRIIPVLMMVTPMLCAIFLIIIHTTLFPNALRSQEALIQRFEHIRHSGESSLFYFKDRPYSAVFYTKGHVGMVENIMEAEQSIDPNTETFFVIRNDYFKQLPLSFKEQLAFIDQQQHYILLRSIIK